MRREWQSSVRRASRRDRGRWATSTAAIGLALSSLALAGFSLLLPHTPPETRRGEPFAPLPLCLFGERTGPVTGPNGPKNRVFRRNMGRGGGIRTHGLEHPKLAHYQAVLHPVSNGSADLAHARAQRDKAKARVDRGLVGAGGRSLACYTSTPAATRLRADAERRVTKRLTVRTRRLVGVADPHRAAVPLQSPRQVRSRRSGRVSRRLRGWRRCCR